jgi:carboxyl-terminal processing protease
MLHPTSVFTMLLLAAATLSVLAAPASTQLRDARQAGGVGVEVKMESGVIKVVSAIEDTPAAKAGVQANDLLTHLDGTQILGLTLEQVIEKMRGPVGTPITLTIARKNTSEPITMTIVREVIRVNAVKSRLEGEVIYVKISTFNEQTHANLVKQVDALKKQLGKAPKGYVLDLRNNPGGLLDQAISVSDEFLDQGEIVLIKWRDLEHMQRTSARPGDITGGRKIVALINSGSVGAAEIVAGALQDHKRATVVGMRSFGMGSVQTVIPFDGGKESLQSGIPLRPDGGIRLTTARFYTPSGRSIQATGINPDIQVDMDADTPHSLAADIQLQRALSLIQAGP